MSLTGRKRRPLNRAIHHLRDAKLFVIAVEGAKRERAYFETFGSSRIQVRVIASVDHKSSPKHVLQRLRDFSREYQIAAGDELWMVIDVDRWEVGDLAQVATQCEQSGIGLAVSNPCFEVWLYLHYAELPVEEIIDCKSMKKKLHQVTNGNSDLTSLKEHQIQLAIERAKKLDSSGNTRWPESTGSRVYKLIPRLLKINKI